MSTNRSRRIDRDAAEHLLGGAVGGPSAGQDASLTGPDGDAAGQVARVLAAAAAPATAAELAGEEAALTAFRAARLAPHPVAKTAPVRRRSMATAALARALSTKAAAAVLGATALCGVAVAAGTGNLLSPLDGGSSESERTRVGDGATSALPTSGHAPGGMTASGPSGRPSGTGSSTTGSQGLGPSASPTPGTPSAAGRSTGPASPALVALCHAFGDRTAKGEHPGRLVLDPVFGSLVAAAGGPDQVEDYCGEALGRVSDDAHRSATPQPPHDSAGPGQGADAGNAAVGGSGNGNGKGNGDGGTGKNSGGTGDGGGAKPGKGGAVPTASPDVHPSRQDQPAQR
ncbi:hypothetical protein ACWCXH_18285 [Kitasatospora sp. NPDC001660]